MVCNRCKMEVKSELEKLGLRDCIVKLGEAIIPDNVSDDDINRLRISLKENGLEMLLDKKSILVEKIKIAIIVLVHYKDEQLKVNLSDYLSDKLDHNYTYLSNLFSELKGTSIEHYYLAQKIERAKELIIYDELNLSEIAFKLHYSSVAHLSNQFRKMTGLTPSQYKKLKNHNRRGLVNV